MQLSLKQYNNSSEQQEEKLCVVYSVCNVVENIINQSNEQKHGFDFREIDVSKSFDTYMGYRQGKTLTQGANMRHLTKCFSENFFPGVRVKLLNVRDVKRTPQGIIEELKKGNPIAYLGKGKVKDKKYWIEGNSAHAMMLDGIDYKDDNNFTLFLENTYLTEPRLELKSDYFLKSCFELITFNIEYNGIILPSKGNNMNNEEKSEKNFFRHNYYDIMIKEVPLEKRIFNDYDNNEELERQIKSLIEIANFRSIRF